jgi:hypothetical protein
MRGHAAEDRVLRHFGTQLLAEVIQTICHGLQHRRFGCRNCRDRPHRSKFPAETGEMNARSQIDDCWIAGTVLNIAEQVFPRDSGKPIFTGFPDHLIDGLHPVTANPGILEDEVANR